MEYIKQYNTNEVYVNEKLTEKIDKINSHPLTVVEAPMGYGKTTAIKIYLNKIKSYGKILHKQIPYELLLAEYLH